MDDKGELFTAEELRTIRNVFGKKAAELALPSKRDTLEKEE